MMGSPSEYYVYGSTYAWVAMADVIACFVAAFIYLPIYHNLEKVSKILIINCYLSMNVNDILKTYYKHYFNLRIPKSSFRILCTIRTYSYISIAINIVQWIGCLFTSTCNEPGCWS